MANRADIAKRRWIAQAVASALASVTKHGDTPTAAVENAMVFVHDVAMAHRKERGHLGGLGLGRVTARAARREWGAWSAEVLAQLEVRLTAETVTDGAARQYDVRDEVRADRASAQPRSTRVDDSGLRPEERTGLQPSKADGAPSVERVTLASSYRALEQGQDLPPSTFQSMALSPAMSALAARTAAAWRAEQEQAECTYCSRPAVIESAIGLEGSYDDDNRYIAPRAESRCAECHAGFVKSERRTQRLAEEGWI